MEDDITFGSDRHDETPADDFPGPDVFKDIDAHAALMYFEADLASKPDMLLNPALHNALAPIITDPDTIMRIQLACSGAYMSASAKPFITACRAYTSLDGADAGLPVLKSNGRTVLQVEEGAFDALIAQTLDAVAATQPEDFPTLYEGAQGLVRVQDDGTIQTLTTELVRVYVGRHVLFSVYDGRKKGHVPKDCPRDLAVAIKDLKAYPMLPFLKGVTHQPLLRKDGTRQEDAGYDPDTQWLYLPTRTQVPWPETLTRDDGAPALAMLRKLLVDFLFETPRDHAAALALALTITSRHLIDGPCPLFAFTANIPGTGKTLLASLMGLIATGAMSPVLPPSGDAEELRKSIGMVRLAGVRAVILDNLHSMVRSAALESIISGSTVLQRALGTNDALTGENTAAWAITGNNLRIGTDMRRRLVEIVLTSDTPHPERRSGWQIPDIREWAMEKQPLLYHACCVLLSTFLQAGAPRTSPELMGGFEAWDKLVRQCLLWHGLPDILETTNRIDDPERETLVTLLSAWQECYAPGAFVALRTVRTDVSRQRAIDGAPPNRWDHLHDACLGLPGMHRDIDTKPLGEYLAKVKDRWVEMEHGIGAFQCTTTLVKGVKRWTTFLRDPKGGPTQVSPQNDTNDDPPF